MEELERQLETREDSSNGGNAQHLIQKDDPIRAMDPGGDYDLTMDPSLAVNEWPLELPSRDLLLHLIEIFFAFYPNSRRIVHRPTFMLQLLADPTSPRFPFIPLLHAICAAAALYSPLVEVAPAPSSHADAIFPEKSVLDQGRNLSFDEQHFILCEYQCHVATREGVNLLGVIQACVISSWWAFSCARWYDVWNANSLATRLCVVLGLNFADSPQNPLPNQVRDKLLIGPPISNTDAELRRNVFWLTYCLERYYLFSSPWVFDIDDEDVHQTLPATLEAFESEFEDNQERQTVLSADLFLVHHNNQDDVALYVKGAVMLSRAHRFECRQLRNYVTAEEAQNSQEFWNVELMISSLSQSLKKQVNQSATLVTSNIFIAYMAPLWATIRLNSHIANWKDPSCESANKALSASRAVLRYTTGLMPTSHSNTLDTVACLPWLAAGKALTYALQHTPESLAPILRAEIKLIRNNLLLSEDRVTLFSRQRRTFEIDVIEILGEEEAIKVFDGIPGL